MGNDSDERTGSFVNLVVANTGNNATYRRPGFGNFIPDVTLTTDIVLSRVERWRVVEDYTASDHHYIAFDVVGQTRTSRTKFSHRPRWNTNRLDEHKLLKELAAVQTPSANILPELTGQQRAERLTDETAELMERLCNNSMPERQYRRDRQPQYWWTNETAELRKNCLAIRRRVTRAGRCPESETLLVAYRTAWKSLTNTIKDSKTKWKKLCEEMGRDPWGIGYKIVTNKLGSRTATELKDTETMRRIVYGLFPTHPIQRDATDDREYLMAPIFTAEELTRATKAIKVGKAPRTGRDTRGDHPASGQSKTGDPTRPLQHVLTTEIFSD